MADHLQPDLCVIGAGSAGLAVAAAARAVGGTVVLIERGRMGGGSRHTGSVPSKALIAAAKAAHTMREAGAFGILGEEPKVNFSRVHEHIQQAIAAIAPQDSAERYEAMGVTVISGEAKFVDRRTVEADGQLVRARRFVIATGSRPAIPSIEGLDQVPYLTNESVFDLTRKPAHLIVIGAGARGLEVAQAHRRLGSEVTVIEAAEPLDGEDPELTAIALRRLADEGVDLRAPAEVLRVAEKGQGIAVTVRGPDGEEATVSGSQLLVAAGRRPDFDGLGLQAARIRHDAGGIRVGGGLKTSNRRVFAIGDVVAGSPRFTHVAGHHASVVVRRALFGLPVRADRDLLPRVVFTDPEIAQIGLTEPEAKRRLKLRYKVFRASFGENDRARAEKRSEGLVKMITDRSGRIIGAGVVGAHAGEMISIFSYMIANRMKASSLMKFVAPYPTLTENVRRLGIEYLRDQLSNPWLARVRDFVRRLP